MQKITPWSILTILTCFDFWGATRLPGDHITLSWASLLECTGSENRTQNDTFFYVDKYNYPAW